MCGSHDLMHVEGLHVHGYTVEYTFHFSLSVRFSYSIALHAMFLVCDCILSNALFLQNLTDKVVFGEVLTASKKIYMDISIVCIKSNVSCSVKSYVIYTFAEKHNKLP